MIRIDNRAWRRRYSNALDARCTSPPPSVVNLLLLRGLRLSGLFDDPANLVDLLPGVGIGVVLLAASIGLRILSKCQRSHTHESDEQNEDRFHRFSSFCLRL